MKRKANKSSSHGQLHFRPGVKFTLRRENLRPELFMSRTQPVGPNRITPSETPLKFSDLSNDPVSAVTSMSRTQENLPKPLHVEERVFTNETPALVQENVETYPNALADIFLSTAMIPLVLDADQSGLNYNEPLQAEIVDDSSGAKVAQPFDQGDNSVSGNETPTNKETPVKIDDGSICNKENYDIKELSECKPLAHSSPKIESQENVSFNSDDDSAIINNMLKYWGEAKAYFLSKTSNGEGSEILLECKRTAERKKLLEERKRIMDKIITGFQKDVEDTETDLKIRKENMRLRHEIDVGEMLLKQLQQRNKDAKAQGHKKKEELKKQHEIKVRSMKQDSELKRSRLQEARQAARQDREKQFLRNKNVALARLAEARERYEERRKECQRYLETLQLSHENKLAKIKRAKEEESRKKKAVVEVLREKYKQQAADYENEVKQLKAELARLKEG